MSNSIIIIGGGIAGLSAGCYAQMNGFNSRIFELHSIPGGLCTSWRRQGYLFDGGLRYLVGVDPRAHAYPMWCELGALQNRPIYRYNEFISVEDETRQALHFYTDLDHFQAQLLALSPSDSVPIRDLVDAVRSFASFDLPIDPTPDDSLENLQLGFAMLPFTAPLLRWKDVTLGQLCSRFRHPLIRQGLQEFLQFSRPDFPALMLLITLAQLHSGNAGYPIGGSLDLAMSIAQRYEALGGMIEYEARVTQILVEAGRAVGVRLADGREIRAEVVISAADGHNTIFELLGGRYTDSQIDNTYQTMPRSPAILQVALGVDRDFSQESPAISFPLRQPIDLGGLRHKRLTVKHYSFDPNMAPAGKAVLSVWCAADPGYWKGLHLAPELYTQQKEQVAQQVIAGLTVRFPGLAERVEAVDVATPVTYERYTANWGGSIYGWAMTMRKMELMMGSGMRKTLPGVDNFYMIGQWVEPAGNMQLSAASGRDVIETICRCMDRPFVTTRVSPQHSTLPAIET